MIKSYRMNWLYLIFGLFLLPTIAFAQNAYKCKLGSGFVYQDSPCRQQPAKPTATIEVKTAAQLQAEFEAEQADIKEGERLQAEIIANKAKAEADKKKMIETAQRSCQAEKNKPAVVVNSSWDGSVYQVKRYLDKTLRDPASFDAIDWGRVQRRCNGYSVWVKYRARNGFGGMGIFAQDFTLDTNGTVVGVE